MIDGKEIEQHIGLYHMKGYWNELAKHFEERIDLTWQDPIRMVVQEDMFRVARQLEVYGRNGERCRKPPDNWPQMI